MVLPTMALNVVVLQRYHQLAGTNQKGKLITCYSMCTYVLYRDYVRLLTCYTYVDIRVIRSVYVYVVMFY
jgi:hypothetical protein